MASLHIQHPITDLATWLAAFAAFGEQRQQAGVLAETVRTPVGDDHFVVIDLDFETADQAGAFLHFLQTVVWATNENSPALVGSPVAKVLTSIDLTAGTTH
jgi:hypothetical protein